MQKSKFSKAIAGAIFTIETYSFTDFSIKFQIWARQYGLTDAESLAVFLWDDPEKREKYCLTQEHLDSGKRKLSGLSKTIDLSIAY